MYSLYKKFVGSRLRDNLDLQWTIRTNPQILHVNPLNKVSTLNTHSSFSIDSHCHVRNNPNISTHHVCNTCNKVLRNPKHQSGNKHYPCHIILIEIQSWRVDIKHLFVPNVQHFNPKINTLNVNMQIECSRIISWYTCECSHGHSSWSHFSLQQGELVDGSARVDERHAG